jgi:hypothetical protein
MPSLIARVRWTVLGVTSTLPCAELAGVVRDSSAGGLRAAGQKTTTWIYEKAIADRCLPPDRSRMRADQRQAACWQSQRSSILSPACLQ